MIQNHTEEDEGGGRNNVGVLHFDGSDLCVQRLACRAISASAELVVLVLLPSQPTESKYSPSSVSVVEQQSIFSDLLVTDLCSHKFSNLITLHYKQLSTESAQSYGLVGLYHRLIGPIPWGHSGPLCHALSLLVSSSMSWTSVRRRRATVPLATSGELA